MSERDDKVAKSAMALAAKTSGKKSAPAPKPKSAKAQTKKTATAKAAKPPKPPVKPAAKPVPKPQPKAVKSLSAAVKTKTEAKATAKPAPKAAPKAAAKPAVKAAPAKLVAKEPAKPAAKVAAKPAPVKEITVKAEKPAMKAEPAPPKATAKPAPKPAAPKPAAPEPAVVAAPPPAPVPAAPAPAPSTAPAPVMHSGVVAGPMRPMTPPRAMAKAEIFVAGDYVVYPTHGVGKVERIATEEIAGHTLELIHITFDENRMTLRVPTNKARTAGLRKLASPKQFADVMATLKGRARIKRTMWSRRAQEYEAKINSGDPQAIAEVVRDLHRNAGQPDQSFSERQIYESALDRLAAEYGALEKVDKATAIERLIAHLKSE
jgi:CarD family transcriptional regulator